MPDDKYTDQGHRGPDPRHGFGDDMGTRVGRPDGARAAPLDASPGRQPAEPSTSSDAVADGLEGSIRSDEGSEQRRVRESVNPDKETGADRPVFDL